MLCKYENLQNRQCIKYLFCPLYVHACMLACMHGSVYVYKLECVCIHPGVWSVAVAG